MTTTENYNNIKAAVLAGMSGYAAAKKFGVDPLAVANRLSRDPDIVKAKADGTVKNRAKRHKTATHYANLDYVRAVMEGGMTQTAAAAQFGKAQAQVAFGVKKAREELAAQAQSQAPLPPTASTAQTRPANQDVALIADLIRAHAQRLNLPAKSLLESVAAVL